MSSPFDDPCLKWRKSSRSGGGGNDCVEVATVTSAIGVRDSKNPAGAKLRLSAQVGQRLVRRIKSGQLDL
jgi:hypothetical protein